MNTTASYFELVPCTNSVSVAPPMDPVQFDECYFMDGDLTSLQRPWSEDLAFWPTNITFGITFVVGVIGNALVIFALCADRKSRNVTSSFLVSLAVADMMFLLICVPYEVVAKVSTHWLGGRALCKIAGFVEMLSGSASVLNLTAVSTERYAVIVHPMKSRVWCTMGNTKKIIIAVWVVAVVLSSPLLHIMDTKSTLYYNNSTHMHTYFCTDKMGGGQQHKIGFAWYQMIVMFLLPVIIMLFCYAVVIHVLWISTKQLAKMTNVDSSADDESKQRLTSPSPRHQMRSSKVLLTRTVKDHGAEIREARKQVIRMLLAIIAVFFLCWGPKLIYNLMKRHEMSCLHTNAGFYLNILFNLLPYVQSCSNPIIYSFMSNNFRRSMRNGCRTTCRCVPCDDTSKAHRRYDYDMETKSANGMSSTTRYSPPMSRTGRSYVTVMSDM